MQALSTYFGMKFLWSEIRYNLDVRPLSIETLLNDNDNNNNNDFNAIHPLCGSSPASLATA